MENQYTAGDILFIVKLDVALFPKPETLVSSYQFQISSDFRVGMKVLCLPSRSPDPIIRYLLQCLAEDGIGYAGVGRGCSMGMMLPPNSNKPSLILHMANCILWFFIGGKQEITILLIKGDKRDWLGVRGTHRSEGNTKEEGSESQKSRASMIPRVVKSSQQS